MVAAPEVCGREDWALPCPLPCPCAPALVLVFSSSDVEFTFAPVPVPVLAELFAVEAVFEDVEEDDEARKTVRYGASGEATSDRIL